VTAPKVGCIIFKNLLILSIIYNCFFNQFHFSILFIIYKIHNDIINYLQIDGSTLKTLCIQHGPLLNFHMYLNHGIALAKYSSREEASKVCV